MRFALMKKCNISLKRITVLLAGAAWLFMLRAIIIRKRLVTII